MVASRVEISHLQVNPPLGIAPPLESDTDSSLPTYQFHSQKSA